MTKPNKLKFFEYDPWPLDLSQDKYCRRLDIQHNDTQHNVFCFNIQH